MPATAGKAESWTPDQVRGDGDFGNRCCLPDVRHPELVSGSRLRPALPQRWKTETDGKITPFGVGCVNKIDLPVPPPVLELLLARNRTLHVVKHLEVNQAINPILRREAAGYTFAVLPQALHQGRRDTDIQGAARTAGKNIHARLPFALHTPSWLHSQSQTTAIAAELAESPDPS